MAAVKKGHLPTPFKSFPSCFLGIYFALKVFFAELNHF
jgi:hypothetical protein